MKKAIFAFLLIPALLSCTLLPVTSRRDRVPPTMGTVTSDGFQTGIASWYGVEEHGRKTASGETFNKHSHTAAHRTLRLGTVVRVVNLENGRDVIVKINDRGPFVSGRIIDLSYASAKSLHMLEKGTAKVRLEVISTQTDISGMYKPSFTVQMGSFRDKKKAHVLKHKLRGKVDDGVRIETFNHRGDIFYRVRVGRFRVKKQAEKLASRLKSSGYRGRVIQE